MALSIQKLGTRAITALVFVLVLLSALLWNYLSFTLLFFVISIWGLIEFYRVCESIGARPQKMTGYLLGALFYMAFIRIGYLPVIGGMTPIDLKPFLILFPFIILAGAVFSKKSNPFTNALYTITGILYSVMPFALLHELVFLNGSLQQSSTFLPNILLGIILLIWCNDTFAYLGGSIFGKHKMIERVSPGKTWEGTVIGVLAGFGGSFIIAAYEPDIKPLFWLMTGIVVPIFATLGDLVQSVMKRQANVKDTGSIMPGHGGILDRFDSLIFVSPCMVVLAELIA